MGEKYTPACCQELIDFCRKPHATLTGYANFKGVTLQTLQNWAEKHKDFALAKRIAWQLMEEYHDVQGSKATYGGMPAFHNASWIKRMECRFGWDKGPPDLDPDELDIDYGDDPKEGEGDDADD